MDNVHTKFSCDNKEMLLEHNHKTLFKLTELVSWFRSYDRFFPQNGLSNKQIMKSSFACAEMF
jgi:hypothetical protein